MLHIHMHEEFSHFAKALLATFLGLLMALGLESCHQKWEQRHVADEAMESVIEECIANRKALQALAKSNQDIPKNLQILINTLQSLQDARAARTPWKMPPDNIALNVEHSAGQLKSSAWNMALADQSFRRFPKDLAKAFGEIYQQINRFQVYLDQPVDYTCLTILPAHNTDDQMRKSLERLSPSEIETFILSLRQLKSRLELIHMWAEGLGRSMDERKRILEHS